ncbi:MAG: GmrSD restriction endonuclease domain-containing protein [Phycisphaerae bacterium]
MSNLTRDISSDDLKIQEIVKQLQENKLLIPTFQRDFVWEPSNILKLWDSIFRFYPIGSILYWETDSYLHTHRQIGGFEFPHDEDTVRKFKEWKYILDGQQRCTSLLVCMLGGKGRVEDNKEFDYTLYFDATKAEFFFADQLDRRRKRVPDEAFLVRVRDVPDWGFTFYKDISAAKGFTPEIEHNLQQLQRMFSEYKLSIIRIRGVETNEVCEIFERINQEGKHLHPVDIIVARTYKNPDEETGHPGFYLRDNLRDLKTPLVDSGSRWQDVDDLLVIQMVAMCLRKDHTEGRNPFGITPKALDNLTAEHFEQNWTTCSRTILETFKLLTDMHIAGPGMLPFVYLTLPICSYLHRNNKPDRRIAKQWFWRNAFGLESFSNSTDVYNFASEFFGKLEAGETPSIEPLTLSRSRLVQSSYNYRNALSRAVLAWLANQGPVDFSDPDAEVLDNVYLQLSHSPNLHHIYPQNFLRGVEELPPDASPDSLMNICFLRARTNIQISDRNPLDYFKDFRSVEHFDRILDSHLIDRRFIERDSFSPADYRDFLYARADAFCRRLKDALPDVAVNIVD